MYFLIKQNGSSPGRKESSETEIALSQSQPCCLFDLFQTALWEELKLETLLQKLHVCVHLRAGKMMGETEAFLSRLWVEGWKEGIGRKSQVLSIRI